MKKTFKISTSVLIAVIMVFSAICIGMTTPHVSFEAKAEENTYDELIELTYENNPIIYSYTASEDKTIEIIGNVWADAILHIEAYSDLNLNNLIAEDHTVVPNGEWAAAPTPHIYINLETEKTVYIKVYADNPRDPTLDINNVTVVIGVYNCVDLTNAEITPPTEIYEYGWPIFKDAFTVTVNGESIGPGDFEIVCNGENIEGECLSPGKHTITVRGIWSAIGSKDIEVEVKAKYTCSDCGEVFINEREYQNHIIEETTTQPTLSEPTTVIHTEVTTKPTTTEPTTTPVTETTTVPTTIDPVFNVEICNPSKNEIMYGDSVTLYTDIDGKIPADANILWNTNNTNFTIVEISEDGRTCTITPNISGDTVFIVTVVDENKTVIGSDTLIITSKADFFDKIIAFFKYLFESTKAVFQIFNNLF